MDPVKKFAYFDNNATTRVAPEVLESMLPYWRELWGNPSSAYRFGNQVAKEIEKARDNVASLLNADPKEIVFTSCGTESNNTAIQSALASNPQKRHVVSTSVEHSSVINYCEWLESRGIDVTYLPVESDGSLDLHQLEQSIRPDTAIVSVMWANNETGVLFPIEEIAAICRSKGVLFHSDGVQVAGKLAVDVKALGVDFFSLSAHKLYAPKGIGALYVRRRVPYQPYIIGGSQEKGRRAGTENVAQIVGFGRAAELALVNLEQEETRVRPLRDRMETSILASIPNSYRNGSRDFRLCNTSNIAFDGAEAEGILLLLDREGICASSGSACATGSLEPSHVLTAMGIDSTRARSSVRFSLGIYTTTEDVNYLLEHLPAVVAKLRGVSPNQ
jgi:cysteine desulfurase